MGDYMESVMTAKTPSSGRSDGCSEVTVNTWNAAPITKTNGLVSSDPDPDRQKDLHRDGEDSDGDKQTRWNVPSPRKPLKIPAQHHA